MYNSDIETAHGENSMATQFNLERYNQLQYLRKEDSLTEEENLELQELCQNHLFTMIEADPELKAVFTRLKDR